MNESKDVEVTIPAVHLVESATGHDIAIGQVKQPLLGDFCNAHVSHMGDLAGKVPNFDSALLVG